MFLRSGRVEVYAFNPHLWIRRSRQIYWTQITNTHRQPEKEIICRVSRRFQNAGRPSQGTYSSLGYRVEMQRAFIETSKSITKALQKLHKCVKTSLKNKFGKYVTLGANGSKLVATDNEDEVFTENLEIWKRDNKIAFCFKDRMGGHCMVSVDANDQFKLINMDPKVERRQVIERNPSTSIWFQLCPSGDDGYCIKMAERTKYWAINSQSVTLTDSARTLGSVFTTSTCHCSEDGCPGVVADVPDASFNFG